MKFASFFKQNLSYYGVRKADADIKQWITVNGAHIPIKYGQSKDEAVKEHLAEMEDRDSDKPKKKPKTPDGSDLPQNLQDNFKKFPRNADLEGNDKHVQEASIHKYLKHGDKMKAEYLEKNGKVANTDEARKLFADVGYEGHNSAAAQEAASALTKDCWRELLKGDGPDAVLFAGGSGTGKTSAIKDLFPDVEEGACAILDGNLSTLKTAENRIAEAREAGKKPRIEYVYRDPADSWEQGVLKRMKDNEAEGGRVVPLSVFLQNHEDSHAVVAALVDDGIPARFIDNSNGKGKAKEMSFAKFKEIAYNKDKIRSELVAITRKEYEEGNITRKQLNALLK